MEESKHLGNKIIILSNQVKHYLHQAAEAEGISGSQSRILHFLAQAPNGRAVYQKDVEEFFFLRRSTVTQNLQAMEKNGLITRCNVEQDARLKKLELTDYGKELEARIHQKVEYMEHMLSTGLTESEIRTFEAVLHKMNTVMIRNGIPDPNLEFCDDGAESEKGDRKGETSC